MYEFIIVVHIATCLLMILVILLQAGRGAGLSVFGSSGDSVLASPSGSSFLKKFTAILAGTFAVTSLMLTLLAGRVGNRSVTRDPVKVPYSDQQQPQAPAAQPETKDAAPKLEKETPKPDTK